MNGRVLFMDFFCSFGGVEKMVNIFFVICLVDCGKRCKFAFFLI